MSDFKVDIKKLLIGAVIALVGLCSLGDPDSILLALAIMAFGVLMVLNALVCTWRFQWTRASSLSFRW